MNSLIIDPIVLAYPSLSSNIKELENYVLNLLEWDKFVNESQIDVLISGNTSEILVLENNYPYWDDLKAVFDKSGLNEFVQPRDIIRILERFLKLKSLEELGIKEVLFDSVIINDESIQIRPASYLDEFKRIAMLIRLYSQVGHQQKILSKTECKDEIYVSGNILDIEMTGNIEMILSTEISGDISTVGSIEEFLSRIKPDELWMSNNIGYHEEAIKIAIFQRVRKIEGERFVFGYSFLKTVENLGFLTEPRKVRSLIRAIVETVLKDNLRDVHSLRTGEGGSDPQVTRGEDKAWRRDIDYEYHLHYWETKDGIEFGSVVVHNDMTIPA